MHMNIDIRFLWMGTNLVPFGGMDYICNNSNGQVSVTYLRAGT